jgi:hypothetical protein
MRAISLMSTWMGVSVLCDYVARLSCCRRSRKQDREGPRKKKSLKTALERPKKMASTGLFPTSSATRERGLEGRVGLDGGTREGSTNLVVQRREGGDEDALENCGVVPVDRHRDSGGCVVLVGIWRCRARRCGCTRTCKGST